MNAHQERVLELARRIASLEQELERLKAEFVSLVPEDAPASTGRVSLRRRIATGEWGDAAAGDPRHKEATRPVEPQEGSEISLSQRIVDLLNGDPTLTFDAEAVAFVLENAKVDSVRTTLARLAEQERIEKVGRGEYRAMNKTGIGPRVTSNAGGN
jgi:regulator of replication initiation timing